MSNDITWKVRAIAGRKFKYNTKSNCQTINITINQTWIDYQ